MRSLTPAQCNHVLELLDKGQSSHAISTTTGISVGSISNIRSKHRSTLSKSIGGCPCKLSPADIQYAIHLITSQKAENATEVSKTLQDMTNTSFSVKTVQRALRSTGMKAVTKQKQPFLSK
jgi:transposase